MSTAPPPVPTKKRGCLFYGCITLAVFLVIGGIGTWLAVRYALNAMSGLVAQYTSTNAIPIETVSISQAELRSLQERLTSFSEGMEGRRGSRELVLSAHDINALIQNQRDYAALKDKLFVILDGDQIKGKISLPLDDFGPLKMKGRYLNGDATFNVSLENGALDVKIKEIRVGDKPLPAPMLAELRKADFAKEFHKDPNARRSIEKLESIQVKDDQITIRAKEPEKP